MGKDNLHVLTGGNNPPIITKKALDQMKIDLPGMLEYIIIMAEMTKAKYDAMIDQGFTKEEALELCKTLF